MQWRHQQEMAEVKHNADLILMELRQSMEAEKQKIISDFKKQAELEKHKAISETKKKQWCSNCGKEAIFYCCWNTSYCDYPCQVTNNFSNIWPFLDFSIRGVDIPQFAIVATLDTYHFGIVRKCFSKKEEDN